MQQTLNFLRVLDQPIRRTKRAQSLNVEQRKVKRVAPLNNPFEQFQYWRGLKFGQDTLDSFPPWITTHPQFVSELYKNYEKKMLILPKICQKSSGDRTSEDIFLLQLFLEDCLLVKGLPNSIPDLIYHNLGVKYYSKDQIVHNEGENVQFIGIIFVGQVEYTENNKLIKKGKKDIIMSSCFHRNNFPTVTAKQNTIIFVIYKQVYDSIKDRLSVEIEERHKESFDELPKSDLFLELHLKDKRSRIFLKSLEIEFFFKGNTICCEGEQPDKFYILFMGKVQRVNHIYIRQHNKWPIEEKKWEIRAVYRSYQKHSLLKQFDFFCDEEIISGNRLRSSYIAKQHSILFSLTKQMFNQLLTTEDFKRLKKYRNQNTAVNYPQFQRDIRKRNRQLSYKKRIIRQAIDTSFCNRSNLDALQKIKKKLQPFQKQMITKASQI